MFDSHCHLTDTRFAGEVSDVIARARGAGVTRMTTIASTLADARDAQAIAEQHEGVWCTAGVHPHEAAGAGDDFVRELRDLCRAPRVVAVGETGLDYHYDHSPRDVQRRVFGVQLQLAAELRLPVVVHCR